ncbi:ABC-type sugar transport system permease subunit [Thermocatellispora tengchongensis]|uniref:ABC-type sugar transport system permease subunit n=1 Tax=Thermocatellispora tengchongensis TaxID=1073253 RepID=A0A840PBC6_9ACTN|nr:sugar ABC transporter permease [Thermocatellispora tengchongensis]MBB5134487.1 ABC-type sugar transport system permease subunit [Thermocatellispora tengchongensis]
MSLLANRVAARRAPATRPARAARGPRTGWRGLLLVTPFFVFFAAFAAYPLYYAFQLSFLDWHGGATYRWAGLDNYRYLLTNPDFWAALGNTALIWLLIVPLQTIGAIAAAGALSRARLRFTRLLRTAVIIPYVTPLAAMAQAFILIFDRDYGVVNHLLGLAGLPHVEWLTSTEWSKVTIALLVLWKTSGFALIVMLAAIQGIPQEVYEAAALDGAGPLTTFWRITVPLMRHAIAFFVVISTLGISQMFLEPYVLTDGGPYNSSTTSGLYLFQHIGASDLGTGAANTFLLVAMVLALSLAAVRLFRESK